MNSLFVILTVLILIASILLTIAVLLQSSKGEGLASNFVAANQTFGVRQTADMLEKVTWGLVAFILVVSIISAFTLRTPALPTTTPSRSRMPYLLSSLNSRPLRFRWRTLLQSRFRLRTLLQTRDTRACRSVLSGRPY